MEQGVLLLKDCLQQPRLEAFSVVNKVKTEIKAKGVCKIGFYNDLIMIIF